MVLCRIWLRCILTHAVMFLQGCCIMRIDMVITDGCHNLVHGATKYWLLHEKFLTIHHEIPSHFLSRDIYMPVKYIINDDRSKLIVKIDVSYLRMLPWSLNMFMQRAVADIRLKSVTNIYIYMYILLKSARWWMLIHTARRYHHTIFAGYNNRLDIYSIYVYKYSKCQLSWNIFIRRQEVGGEIVFYNQLLSFKCIQLSKFKLLCRLIWLPGETSNTCKLHWIILNLLLNPHRMIGKSVRHLNILLVF